MQLSQLALRSVTRQSNGGVHARGPSSHAVAAHHHRLRIVLCFATSRARLLLLLLVLLIYMHTFGRSKTRTYPHTPTRRGTNGHQPCTPQHPTVTGCTANFVWSRLVQSRCQTPAVLFWRTLRSVLNTPNQYSGKNTERPSQKKTASYILLQPNWILRPLYGYLLAIK